MKLNFLIFSLAAAAADVARATGNFPNGAMWIFGSHGLKIFSTDGSTLYKHSKPQDVCPLNAEGEPNCRSFSDVVSDGDNYIWTASDNRNGPQVEVFDIDSGDLAGVFPTCKGPRGLTFLPLRQEVWFRCTSPHASDPDGESGYWDSFSTTSIDSNSPEVSLRSSMPSFNETSYGIPAFPHHNIIGYSSDYSNGVIHKVDLDKRVPLSNITIPLANGGWDMVYNPTNEHLFLKTYVCCTCGGDDKDLKECVQYRGGVHADPVTIRTGPSADPNNTQIGACGRHCENSKADTIGVAEVDTKTDTIVGYHKNTLGFGASSVFLSPDGQYTVLVSTPLEPANIRLLRAGANGQMSTLHRQIDLPTESRIGNHVFITRNIIAIPSSGDKNQLYFVDISSGKVHTIQLDPQGTSTASSRGRKLKFISGTPYLWVTAQAAEEDKDRFCYVVEINFDDLAKSKVARKVTDVDTHGMVFVEYMNLVHFERSSGKRQQEFNAKIEQAHKEIAQLESELSTLRSEVASAKSPGSSSSSSLVANEGSSSDDSSKALGATGIVIGLIALVVAIFGIAKKNTPQPPTSTAKDLSNEDSSTEVKQGNGELKDGDDYSMDSEQRQNFA